MQISVFKLVILVGVARGALEGSSIAGAAPTFAVDLSSSEVLLSTALSAITSATSEVEITTPETIGHTESSTVVFIPGTAIHASKTSSGEQVTTTITSGVTLVQTLEPNTISRTLETSSKIISSTVFTAVASPVSYSYAANETMTYTPETTSYGPVNFAEGDFASTFDWKRVSINTEPIVFTVPTQVQEIAKPTEATTIDAITSSFVTTDANDAPETISSFTSDEPTNTGTTTTTSRGTKTYKSTITIEISSLQSFLVATTSGCVLSTVFITVTPTVSTAINDNLETTSSASVSTETSKDAVTILYGTVNKTPKYEMANSTFVGNGIPTELVPASRSQTHVTPSASEPLASVYTTKTAQPVFTGGAGGTFNVLNHNKTVLVAFAALITLAVNGGGARCFL